MLKPFYGTVFCGAVIKSKKLKALKKTNQVISDQMYNFSLYPKELQYKKRQLHWNLCNKYKKYEKN